MIGALPMALSDREVSIYIGRNCVGRVIERDAGNWTAIGTDDEPFGLYPSRAAATAAIIAAAKASALR